MSMVRLATGP